MGIFDIFKKKDNEIENLAKKHSKTAVDYAKKFKKKLDYSSNSMSDLEEILAYYSDDIYKSRPTENQIWSMALIFGSYLGETMLKNGLAKKGYYWGEDNNTNVPLLRNKKGSFITPNDKVYKRLVNGPEDNVAIFYDVIMFL